MTYHKRGVHHCAFDDLNTRDSAVSIARRCSIFTYKTMKISQMLLAKFRAVKR